MLILACADSNILTRWRNGLDDGRDHVTVDRLATLRHRLRGLESATVILHLSLPGIDGLGDVERLLRDFPRTGLLVMSEVPNEHEGVNLVRMGALGYANAHLRPGVLAEAIKVVELGEVWVSKRLLHWMVNHCHEIDRVESDVGSYLALDSLTPSERHVVGFLSQGNSNKQIARKLNISERTVKAHLTSIYQKTGVSDRLHLAVLIHHNSVG